MSRVLANKCALSIRVDALGDQDTTMIGAENRVTVEKRLCQLEGREISFATKQTNQPKKYDPKRDVDNPNILKDAKLYDTATDSTITEVIMSESSKKKRKRSSAVDEDDEAPSKKKKKSEKEEKKKDRKSSNGEKEEKKKDKKKDRKSTDGEDGKKKSRKSTDGEDGKKKKDKKKDKKKK